MIVHGSAVIPQIGAGELCHLLDVQLHKHGHKLITVLPTLMQPQMATTENPACVQVPGLMLIFQKEVSDEEGKRILERRPKPAAEPGETQKEPTERAGPILLG
jgi:hypothetical protein